MRGNGLCEELAERLVAREFTEVEWFPARRSSRDDIDVMVQWRLHSGGLRGCGVNCTDLGLSQSAYGVRGVVLIHQFMRTFVTCERVGIYAVAVVAYDRIG